MINFEDPLTWCLINGVRFEMGPDLLHHKLEMRRIIPAKHPPLVDMKISNTQFLARSVRMDNHPTATLYTCLERMARDMKAAWLALDPTRQEI